MSRQQLRVDGRIIRDSRDRQVTLRGINVAGDAKFPTKPNLPSFKSDGFFDGDSVSFIGRPFPVAEAQVHFSRLKRWGYNTIRYIFTWEAIEHERPGQYDEEWISYTIEVLRVAKSLGLYVFMDPHQDVWSRFSGGSGAPMWTLYACGLDPERFQSTQAALVQNTYTAPAEFPKMIWATNYSRLACQVLFTLFFAGREFAPKAILNGQNIQDYLQDHFINACRHLALRIKEAGDLEGSVVIGWESMNEPNRGLIGWQDLTIIPAEQKLRKGASPTAWQAILTGSGRACEVETWDFGGLGPYKSGTELVDPKGETAWLPAGCDDSKYGWSRHPDWKLGECIWAQHGVWDPLHDEILIKDYFSRTNSGDSIDYEYFTNQFFMTYYRKHKQAIRDVFTDAILFCQPPVLEIPPSLKGTEDDDPNMIFAPHFYDGITLITKRWNRYWNVDVFGILRGKYLTPAFAIKIGETAIRNCFRDQLSAIRQEGIDYMGEHPCVFTEIGIPYDMDDKYAYKTGDFSSQIAAMDANHFALEGCGAIGYTLWVYVSLVRTHHRFCIQLGSLMEHRTITNGAISGMEKTCRYFRSMISLRPPLLTPPQLNQVCHLALISFVHKSPHSLSADVTTIIPEDLKSTLKTPSIPSDPAAKQLASTPGYRAAEAFIRPSPFATAGDVIRSGFDLHNCTFELSLQCSEATTETALTEVFLPDFHFPPGTTHIEISSGKWTIDSDSGRQILKWTHDKGNQNLTVKGVLRAQGALSTNGEPSYLEQCRQLTCSMM